LVFFAVKTTIWSWLRGQQGRERSGGLGFLVHSVAKFIVALVLLAVIAPIYRGLAFY